MRKITKLKVGAQWFFTIIGIISTFYVLTSLLAGFSGSPVSLSPGPVSYKDAQVNLNNHHRRHSYRDMSIRSIKTKCIVYDYENFKNYVNNVFPDILAQYSLRNSDNLKWAIGFYPMVYKDANNDGKPRIGLYMIPTLARYSGGSIKSVQPYNFGDPTPDGSKKAPPPTSFIYDYGNMNP